MPLSSSQIAQMNAQYQGAMMGQMQQAQMIGAMPMAEAFTGGTMNRMAAIGGPMASLGLGLAGLDPLSIGLRAGMGASSAGMGFAGAGMVGVGAAGLAAGGLMAAGYVGNQVFTGAQQQQAFNASMNSTFRFANQYGGTGFTRSGLGDIGSMMRQMTTEQGPMGQMVGFEELGRLAANMGRMGMAQGVRDAKDFSDKFREMIKTVKQIAESMGTSLEEAQKMMGAMRGAGIFGNNNAAAFAGRVRLGAVAGGMATSELTGMMQVGSQISRMVGGRGRAGAAGGLETITNIGVAQQMGIMSEEDVYNVTGLTGAEGRRAMATRQMEQSAQFLQGSLGRRFLASVAGKNGKLDASSVEEYMAGGVGTDRTTSMYQRNLGRIGRADFIRNEGRLRGAALEQFGGLAPMIAMKGWLDERGINVNEGNDRAMIFMQRQLGMGTDEAEMMLRQVKELPNLLRQRRIAGQDDAFMHRMEERRSHTGLEGIKHKFEKARSEVQGYLQQAGATFYEQMSDAVDGFINRLTDTYVKETRNDVAGAFRSMMSGGAMGALSASTTFGIGGKSFSSRAGRASNLLGGGPSDMSVFQGTDAENFAKAGFGFKGGSLTQHMANVSQITGIFKSGDITGMQDATEIMAAGANSASAFRQSLMGDMGNTKGMDRLASFGTFLRGQAGLGGLADRYAAASDVEKARILKVFSSKGGADQDQAGAFQDPGMHGVYGQSGMRTLGEGADAVGAAFGNRGRSSMFGGASVKDARVGAFLLSETGRDLIGKMMSDSASVRASARADVEKQVIALKGKDGRTDAEEAQMRGLKGMLMSQKLTEMEVNGATQQQLDAEAERLAKENGISATEVRSANATIGALAERNKKIATDEAGLRYGEEARGTLAGLRRGGLVTEEGGSLKLSAAAARMGGGDAGQMFLNAMLETQTTMAQMGPGANNKALLEKANDSAQKMNLAMGSMSVAQMRELAGNLVGVEGTEEARADLNQNAAVTSHIQAGKKQGKGGRLSAAADVLGVNISAEQIQKMMGKGGDINAVAKRIAGELGMSGNEAFMSQLTSSLSSIQSGHAEEGAVGLRGLMNNESVQKARNLQRQNAEANDPTAQLRNIAESTKGMATDIHSITGPMLEYLSANSKGNAEKKTA